MASVSEEYGARNSVVVTPAAPAIASCVCFSSRFRRAYDWYERSTCENEWMPTSLPWSTVCFTRSG